MKNKPAYGIESVDHALHLALLLQQEGPLRVTDAAARLGVARSTAHRLLSMLVYRDFAVQQPDRRYVAGPVLHRSSAAEPAAILRQVALPHLEALTARTGETSNLVVVVADEARFAATVECDRTLRVGDRESRALPAHLASGGWAVLAARDPEEVRALYEETDVDVEALLRDLQRVRRQGFAVNDQKTETGVTAIGCLVGGSPAAAISLAMPTVRYDRAERPRSSQAGARPPGSITLYRATICQCRQRVPTTIPHRADSCRSPRCGISGVRPSFLVVPLAGHLKVVKGGSGDKLRRVVDFSREGDRCNLRTVSLAVVMRIRAAPGAMPMTHSRRPTTARRSRRPTSTGSRWPPT